MKETDRHKRIVEYLRIKPISHGQVYTFQIAVPESEVIEIPLERNEYLSISLTQQGTNLIPLIVRRTEAYSEEEEYEVIYGADWCLVAKELDIEKLWVWVFDMNDEQANAAKEEMQQLLAYSSDKEKPMNKDTDIASLLENKLKPIYSKINQLFSNTTANVEKSDYEQKLTIIESQLKNLSLAVESLTEMIKELIPPPKLNLLTANEEEVKNALDELGANKIQRNAAWEAIKYWKQPGKTLNWENLKKSATSSREHKIKSFANGTFQKLKTVAEIRSK